MKTSLLLYDIPTNGSFPNPSGYLRSRALRINLSCWVVDQERTPWNLLHEMSNATPKVDWHLIEFSEGATEAILKLAHANMVRELHEAQEREVASLIRMDAALAEVEANVANGPRTIEAARRRHARDRASTLKRTEKLVKDLQTACEMFGMDHSNLPFGAHRDRISGIRALNGSRAEFYTQMTEAVRETPMAQAAANGEVPADILADYAGERGMETEAARSAFADTTTAESRDSTRVLSGSQEALPALVRGSVASREFRAMTRNGVRRVWSTFTNAEAARIIREAGTRNDMANDLARRVERGLRLTARQLPWLHIHAVELTPAAPESNQEPPQSNEEFEVQTGNDVAREHSPAPLAEQHVPEVLGSLISWFRDGTGTAEMSDLGIKIVPEVIRVVSHATGVKRDYRFVSEALSDEGEVMSVLYRCDKGLILTLLND